MWSKQGALVLCTLACVLSLGSVNHIRIPAEPGRGEEWLRWNQETRQLLAYAYLVGYQDGSIDGCAIADELFARGQRFYDPRDFPMAQCMEKRKKFSEPLELYIETITEFYETYPADQKIPARFVLRKLYDGAAVSLEQLHKMAQSGELIH